MDDEGRRRSEAIKMEKTNTLKGSSCCSFISPHCFLHNIHTHGPAMFSSLPTHVFF